MNDTEETTRFSGVYPSTSSARHVRILEKQGDVPHLLVRLKRRFDELDEGRAIALCMPIEERLVIPDLIERLDIECVYREIAHAQRPEFNAFVYERADRMLYITSMPIDTLLFERMLSREEHSKIQYFEVWPKAETRHPSVARDYLIAFMEQWTKNHADSSKIDPRIIAALGTRGNTARQILEREIIGHSDFRSDLMSIAFVAYDLCDQLNRLITQYPLATLEQLLARAELFTTNLQAAHG